MNESNESDFTKACDVSFVKQFSGYVVPYVGSMRNKNGVADRWWCCREFWDAGLGGGVWIEFKGANRRLEPLQVGFLNSVWMRCPGTTWILKQNYGLFCGIEARLDDLSLRNTAYAARLDDPIVNMSIDAIVAQVVNRIGCWGKVLHNGKG